MSWWSHGPFRIRSINRGWVIGCTRTATTASCTYGTCRLLLVGRVHRVIRGSTRTGMPVPAAGTVGGRGFLGHLVLLGPWCTLARQFAIRVAFAGPTFTD